MNDSQTKAVVLFSGGTDSTLAAIRMAEKFDRIILLTLVHCGLSRIEAVSEKAERLGRFFGDPTRFETVIIPSDRLFRFVLYEKYFRHLITHRSLLLSHCGLCKLSFHWRALIYCLENNIKHIADGAVKTSEEYPAQNERIMLSRLRRLYSDFNIHFENPIYHLGESAEKLLFDLRFNKSPKIKGTIDDRQIICEQQILFAMFQRFVRPWRNPGNYENKMAGFYEEKISNADRMTRKYLSNGKKSELAELLEY